MDPSRSSTGVSSSSAQTVQVDNDLPALAMGAERHTLQPQEELRVEVPFINKAAPTCITLQKGSCELWGCELALGKQYALAHQTGGLQLALFTWHGCVLDLQGPPDLFSYTSDETDANVAFVNTHAQLEALRDVALQHHLDNENGNGNANGSSATASASQGPRVLVVGPPESGKSSLCKTLLAYAVKVGRTPLWVDLDPHDNAISVPGTLSVAPMTSAAITVETYATCAIPPNTVHPLVLWHGTSSSASSTSSSSSSSSTSASGDSDGKPLNVDLFQAQVDRIAASINARFQEDGLARASGIIVNTNGWIQVGDGGYQSLLYAAEALEISVILILGHDRLYSMMTNHFKEQQPDMVLDDQDGGGGPKVIKLPRSGGVVSRPEAFQRQIRSRAVKRYFYGDFVDPTAASASSGNNNNNNNMDDNKLSSSSTTSKNTVVVPQLTPFLLQLPIAQVEIYKLSSMALSRSLLPVAQQQTTDTIQITKVPIAEALQHSVVAVCHPHAVAAYTASGRGRDLWTGGVAGFCVVERVLLDTDTVHLLSPCAGSLPSHTLLLGDVTWME